MTTTLALIVARGGSKTVPRKNLRLVADKPLIVHTFDAARGSKKLGRVVLSTDDAELAELAARHGVETPFTRPAELATDESPVVLTALHALAWLAANEKYEPDYVMLLQPTSPLRTAADIDAAIAMAEIEKADAVVSVVEADRHPYLMKTVDPAGRLSPFLVTGRGENRRQDLPPAFSLNGAVYLARRTVLLEKKTWCPDGALAYIMPAERSLDVDTQWDIQLADLILRKRNEDDKI